MTSEITEPGLYQNFAEDAYHADPCPEPSASRSILQVIASKTPRHAFVAHPRLNPKKEEEHEAKFDLGSAVHTNILGRGKRVIEARFENWQTKAAKEFRDQARKQGFVPILTGQLGRVVDMTGAIMEQLPEHGLGHLFKEETGRAEVEIGAWVDPVGGWSRCMIDWLEQDLTITDLKTTEVELTEDGEALGRHMSNMGYELQHAMYERCLTTLFPHMAGRVKFRFLFCEVKEPYAIMPMVLPADAILKGHALIEKGMQRWSAAKASGQWPRFQGGDRIASYPVWSTADYLS